MYKKIIYITGMPRSGTSWLSQIFDSSPNVRFRLSPLFSYEFKNYLTINSSRDDWEYVLKNAYKSDNEFMNQSERRKAGQYPTFPQKVEVPEFLVIKDTRFHNLTERFLTLFDDIKVVAIVRNPCGAINSWLRTPGEFPVNAEPEKEWKYGECRKGGYGEFWGFEDWKSVTSMHLRLEKSFPDRVKIQSYENLVKNTNKEVIKLFNFCDLNISGQTESFLEDCHSRHDGNEYAVFKERSVMDQWKTTLDANIKNQIVADVKSTELERFLV